MTEDELNNLIIDLLEDVIYTHSCPASYNYNDCDKDPCMWCEDAKKVIAELKGEMK